MFASGWRDGCLVCHMVMDDKPAGPDAANLNQPHAGRTLRRVILRGPATSNAATENPEPMPEESPSAITADLPKPFRPSRHHRYARPARRPVRHPPRMALQLARERQAAVPHLSRRHRHGAGRGPRQERAVRGVRSAQGPHPGIVGDRHRQGPRRQAGAGRI